MSNALTRAQIADLCGCKATDLPKAPAYSLVNYTPPGPVCEAYIKSQGPIDGVTGPAGSGKTVGSIFKVLRFSVAAVPVTKDLRVKVRGAVLRDNYRALYRTTLRSWFEFIPPDWEGAVFTGGQDRPAQHVIKLATVRTIDGVRREVPVDLTVDFFAVGDVAIEELLKGYECTWVWCNEGDLLHERVIPFAYSRTGRYPPREQLLDGGRRPRMVAVDFNPPRPNHSLWKAMTRGSFQQDEAEETGAAPVKKVPLEEATVHFFPQPSGLSLDAENRAGKSYEEYLEESRTLPEEDVRRFVHGLPGYARDGKPVYAREFNRKVHIAAGPLAVLPGLKHHIGFDQGLTPAGIVCQLSTMGQLRVLAEHVPGHGVGYQRFASAMLLLLRDRVPGLPPGTYAADPAGFYGADKLAGELTWAQAVSAALAHPIYPAPTNEPGLRIESVKLLLSTMIDAQTPAIIIDPRCTLLIEGFEAEYKYPKHRPGAAMEFGDAPVKNLAANPHDALQYICLALRGRAGVIEDAARAGRPGNVVPMQRGPVQRPGDFDVFSV